MANNNISIAFEKGVFRISAEIPVARAKEAIESIVGELNSQLLGEECLAAGQTAKVAPRALCEKDAAKYIGRSVSFLRTCRYKARRGEMDAGPRYIRVRGKFIMYPVKELDAWLERNRLFATCLEERIYSEGCEIVDFPEIQTDCEVTPNA